MKNFISFTILLCFILFLANTLGATPVTENFETEIIGATTFSQGGYDFSASGDFEIESWGNYGSGSSAFWLGTGSLDGGTAGLAGAISITTADSYFTLTSFDGWTSRDDGNSYFSGNVSFTGTEYLTGNLFTGNVFINPTSSTGSGWDTGLNFSATALNGINLVSLSVDLSANSINYFALDNLGFDITTISDPGGTPVPEPATMLLFGFGLLGLAGINRRKQ